MRGHTHVGRHAASWQQQEEEEGVGRRHIHTRETYREGGFSSLMRGEPSDGREGQNERSTLIPGRRGEREEEQQEHCRREREREGDGRVSSVCMSMHL